MDIFKKYETLESEMKNNIMYGSSDSQIFSLFCSSSLSPNSHMVTRQRPDDTAYEPYCASGEDF